jgi:heat shock protein 5
VDYIVQFIRDEKEQDITKDRRAMSKVKTAAIAAKHALSFDLETIVHIDDFFNSEDLDVPMSRSLFEDLCKEDFARIIPPLEAVMTKSRWKKSDLDQILLVGGSTRIPKVKEIVRDFFGQEPSQVLNPDEAVAIGAAIQGSVLAGDEGDVVLLDVNPLSLGIELKSGKMSVLIPRSRHIPLTNSKTYPTSRDGQWKLDIKLFEGEFPMTADNHFLGEFEITGIRKAKRGEATVEVTMEIDADAIVTVTAVDVANKGNRKTLRVTPHGNRLSEEEVNEAVERAKRVAGENASRRKATRLHDTIRQYLTAVKNGINGGELDLDETNRQQVLEIVERRLRWLDEHEGDEDPAIFSGKLAEAVGELEPLIGNFEAPEDEPEDGDEDEGEGDEEEQ